ncbi:MAG TPA: ComF family protein [Candidatus Obscuribacterales bacterium]
MGKFVSAICMVSRSIQPLLDLIFPERCRACGSWCSHQGSGEAATRAVCRECFLKLSGTFCPAEWLSLSADEAFQIVSGTVYCGLVKKLIYKLKYDGDRALAYDLSLLLERAWGRLSAQCPVGNAVLIPIPLNWQRQQQRGFNQAELMARCLAEAVDLPVDVQALRRIKNTAPQHGLDRLSRKANLSGAFEGDPRRIQGRFVILVDDIYTSGATLVEAA